MQTDAGNEKMNEKVHHLKMTTSTSRLIYYTAFCCIPMHTYTSDVVAQWEQPQNETLLLVGGELMQHK